MIDGDRDAPHDTLALGCFASLCRDRLSEPLVAFTARHPEVTIGVHELSHAALLPAVRAGTLALAVVPAEPVADLAAVALWTEQVVVLAAADHPLAARDAVSPAALAEALLLSTGDELDRFLLARLFPAARPAVRTIPDERALLAAVASGEGVALARAEQCGAVPAGIVARPVASAAARLVVRGFWRDAAARSGPLRDAVALMRAYAER